jgi:hypothetical protein
MLTTATTENHSVAAVASRDSNRASRHIRGVSGAIQHVLKVYCCSQ